MNVWIITTGSSDVQLKNNRWNTLCSKVRSELGTSRQFSCSESEQTGKKLWRYPSRAMGIVYGQALAKYYNDLDFPLLNSFSGYLKKEQIELNQIIVLLTDQSDVISAVNKGKPSHPYWQDTCTLKPILQHYLNIAFPDVVMDSDRYFPVLKPKSGSVGLDDWNEVLKLVQQELKKLDIPEDATVYVSHQAGTPAISSAVQFSSLARFRNNVQFLVSNEYSQTSEKIHNSNYLGAIQLQEAKALLERHDYTGVRDILGLTNTVPSSFQEKRIKYLLDAGEQWNFAEFLKFKKIVVDRKLLSLKNFPWYQSGYESVYLAWVRLEQGSTVDALFHSFRAAEGTVIKWAEKCYSSHVVKDSKYGLQIKLSICQELPDYFNALSDNLQANFQKRGKLGLYGDQLYELLKQARPDWENHPDIKIVWEVAKKERNNCFHRLEGLQESEVFDAWDTKSKDDWKNRILSCINFIAKEHLPQQEEFTSLEEASLMAKVHDELVESIARYELQTSTKAPNTTKKPGF
ncbi:hypothetical protein [Microcoleus sp. bin38.metabat.b11b12b14.051]|uniref:hypothetical protein n=1 Tax=Microcoleus sp. bin38.metabat.b11b12b14.051 TaxID=2742709 RepID=UPI0025E90266|nr:hypothetical protein [Microcoleus sp. bin38.metabat.b11b12b14.051]